MKMSIQAVVYGDLCSAKLMMIGAFRNHVCGSRSDVMRFGTIGIAAADV